MIVLEESGLRFEFDDETPFWPWIIYADKDLDFEKVKKVVMGTKSADFIGLYESDGLQEAILMEVKNYVDESDLPDKELGIIESLTQKIRDSLAVVVGANRNSTHNLDAYKNWLRVAISPESRLLVIFWLDFPKNWNDRKLKSTKGIFRKTLQQKLKW